MGPLGARQAPRLGCARPQAPLQGRSFSLSNQPVERITWFDAVNYCNQRSAAEGFTPVYTITNSGQQGVHIISGTVTWDQSADGYRLLTEAEWEYACRATGTDAFCNGGISQTGCGSEPYLGLVAWYCNNAESQTHAVTQKSPNNWGLSDMHGNVWEWCWDWYASYGGAATDPCGPDSGSLRVYRGGCWGEGAQHCRSAYRRNCSPSGRYDYMGMRLARTAF
ncbi:MAG: SUMF1/EgtB/PvdO family nonheme iron enzyme [Candidatus Eisenbacteria bacterium]|nr:SUMF1/EgtB/PvdO family nonheme iron enzyme [Candidatus Eisenbacteria bacterium]